MPTYDYRCTTCGRQDSVVQSMREYSSTPIRPTCHGQMERHLSVVPAMSGLANALAGDRHYDGLRAPDGTDISSRTKHREYMARTGLTTVDDFQSTFAKAEKARREFRGAEHKDAVLREEITKQVMTAVAKPD
jgi:putative FmdB family regulatory protein